MKRIIVTVGLPRSGKTTWAKGESWPIVNPDSIRIALHGQRFFAPAEPLVWAFAVLMVKSLLLAGHENVIVDGCHNKHERRIFWEDAFEDEEDCFVIFEIFRTGKEECIERAKAIGDEEIIPVIERMAGSQDFMEK